MRTRTIYFLTLCWKKDGEVFQDFPLDEEYLDKADAIFIADTHIEGFKSNYFYGVWEMEQKWDEEYRQWVAGPSKIVYKTKRGKVK